MIPKRKCEKKIPICCIDSYRSHGEHCKECSHPQHKEYPKQRNLIIFRKLYFHQCQGYVNEIVIFVI